MDNPDLPNTDSCHCLDKVYTVGQQRVINIIQKIREAKEDPSKPYPSLSKEDKKSPDFKFTDTDLLNIMKDNSTTL